MFGNWLREHFPRDANSKHKSAQITWTDQAGPSSPLDVRRVGQGHVGSLKLKVVCRSCNNGWLSGLETSAKCVLPPLIVGRRARIGYGAQSILAAWAAKTAMVAEYTKPSGACITQEERNWLKSNTKAPIDWYIWIAAYEGEAWRDLSILQTRVGLSEEPVRRPSEAPHDAQATTFGVGNILFCAMSSRSPFVRRQFTKRDYDGLLQIWPPRLHSIVWPPARTFGDEEAYALADLFNSVGVFECSLSPGANWKFQF